MLDGEIVYIPKELVEQVVESTPGEFFIEGRSLAHDIKITQNRVPFSPGPTAGLESPFTGASVFVLHLAFALASPTAVQTHVPGAPL